MMNRNEKAELFNDLHMGKCEVLFQKVNGERRKMICTLAPKAVSYTHLTLPTTPYV